MAQANVARWKEKTENVDTAEVRFDRPGCPGSLANIPGDGGNTTNETRRGYHFDAEI